MKELASQRKNQKGLKKAVSLVLSVIMLFGLFPFAASAATPLSYDVWTSGSITSATNEISYSFTVPASGKLRLETRTFFQDVYYDILGSDQQTVIKTINPVGGTSDVAKLSDLDTYLVSGTYYVRVRKYANLTGNYSLKVSFTDAVVSEQEPNDTSARANTLTSGKEEIGIIATTETLDFYKITTTSSGKIEFSVRTYFSDVFFDILDTDGFTDIKSINPMGGTEAVPFNSGTAVYLEAGTYYVRVRKYADNVGKYALTATFTACGTTEQEPNNSSAQANSLISKKSTVGIIATNEVVDFYKFIVEEAGKTEIETTNYLYDVYYDVLESNGTTVITSFNPIFGTEAVPRVYTENLDLEIGDYYIRVRKYNSYDGKYELKVSVPPITAQSVSVDPDMVDISKGETVTIIATVDPEKTEDKTLTWTSSDEAVATVDENGTITGISGGTAIITVTTSNGKTNSVAVKVTVFPDSVTVSPKTETLELGEALLLTATLDPVDITETGLVWSSDNEDVALVNEDGKVETKGPGTAEITVTTENGKTDTAVIRVKISPDTVTVSPKTETIELGDTLQLTAFFEPENTTETKLTWTSNAEEIVSVNEDGLVETKGPGTATITVTTENGKTDTAVIRVKISPDTVTVLPKAETVEFGETFQLTALFEPENTTETKLTWTSNAEDIATVTEDGLVETKGPGTATITVTTENGKTDTAVIRVKISPDTVTVSPKTETVELGDTLQLTAFLEPENTTETNLIWSSDAEEVASVNEDGLVETRGPGMATITVTTENGKTDTAIIRVKISPDTITVSPKTDTLELGETLQLTAFFDPANTTETKLAWTSDEKFVALVNEGGMVETKGPGTATITVTTENGKADTAVIHVIVTPTGISLPPEPITLGAHDTFRIFPAFTPENATETTLTWNSDNEVVASVDDNGLITANRSGTATITATTVNGISDSITVRVILPTMIMRLNSTKALLDGKEISTDPATLSVSPFTLFGKTMVPVRFMENVEGVKVSYNAKTMATTVTYNDTQLFLELNNKKMKRTVGGKVSYVNLQTPSSMVEGKTYIPVREVAEQLGFFVKYDSQNYVIVVTMEELSAAELGKKLNEGKNKLPLDVAGVRSITAVNPRKSMKVGEAIQLSAVDVTFDPDKPGCKRLLYSSDAPAVASITSQGRVIAMSKGVAKITVSSHNGKTTVITVTVS